MFFDHPRPAANFATLSHPGGCGFLRFAIFVFGQVRAEKGTILRRLRGLISTASVRRTIAAIPRTRNSQPLAISAEFLSRNTGSFSSLGSWPSNESCSRAAGSQRAHWKYASRPSRIGRVVLNRHTTRRHWSLLVDLPSSVVQGQLAIKHKGTKANREVPRLPRRVVIAGCCALLVWSAR